MKRDLAIVERELFLHRAHANCIRAIGDGIAWRALGYDRAALRALSGKAVKQQILEQGTINELHQWAFAFDTGQGLAIFNSLTNWLAIGDITVVKNDGTVEIVEVKSGVSDSGRITRQKQTMKEVTDLLKNGKGKLEGQDVTIVRFDVSPENDLAALFGLLDEAGRSGFSGRRISNCCYIEAFDFRAMGRAEAVWEQGVEQRKKEIAAWSENDDFVIRIDSLDILSFTPNCAPFSVFPFPERMCVDLLTGAKNYSCFLNLTELGREFERHGWRIEKGPQEILKDGGGPDSPVFRLHKDGMHPEVPPAEIMRMTMETIRPSAMIQTLEAVLKLGPEGISSMSAAATATNILAHEPSFRLGFGADLLVVACYIAVTALFYDLFKPVNRSVSLLAAFFSLVGCAIQGFACLFELAPLAVLGGGRYLSIVKVEQLQRTCFSNCMLRPTASRWYFSDSIAS